MLNFASLFNQFRSSSGSGISELLDQPNMKLARLLDEDAFLSDYKSGNSKVVQFMKYERMEELLEYLVVVGPADDKKRSHKFPLAACDLLSVDNNTAVEFFFPEKKFCTVTDTVFEEVEEEVEIDDLDSSEKSPEQQPIPVDSPEGKTEAESPNSETSGEKAQAEPKIQAEKTIIKDTLQVQNQQAQTETENIKKQEELSPSQGQGADSLSEEGATPQKKKKTKLVKVTKKVQHTVTVQVPPLIGKLLSYFDGQVNYTLAGYVSKVLGVFLTKKPDQVLACLLQPKTTQKLLAHAQSRSVGELIVKMLSHQSTLHFEERSKFFQLILKKLSIDGQVHVLSNISSYVVELIEKAIANLKGANKISEFAKAYFSLETIILVIGNVMSKCQNVSVYNAPVLFAYLTNVPLVLPEDKTVLESFQGLLQDFVQRSSAKLKIDVNTRPKLGTGRVKIVEILRFLLKQNVLNVRQLVARQPGFFSILLNLMRNYEMNNVLHNEIVKIIEVGLTEDESSPLGVALLSNDLLLNFILEEAAEDKKIRAGDSTFKHRKGYIAHIVNLCIRINELAPTNPTLLKLSQNSKFVSLFQTFVEKEVFQAKKNLAGFSMRKDLKHEIMFQKEDIITAYMGFLSKCPSPVFDAEPQHINIEHPDLVQQLQKQLEDSLTLKDKPVQQENIEVVIESAPVQATFWVTHLEYDVDSLLLDL